MSLESPPFKKILIANRGEIAVRVIRTCKELGIKTVAVYSSVDKDALHVLMADEACYIGPPEPLKSYLNMDAIIKAAKRTGAEAIHPGYGFLSQNPDFAERCEEEGLVFIGPSAEVHRFSGDKVGAKRFLAHNGIPVVPGKYEPLTDVDEALDVAESIGYPVMLKPRFGGGGIGMRICHGPDELREAFMASSKLALSAFGRSELYLEKYYPRARHIEVQILVDKRGRVIHLFERECSIQRRFQKILEEAPSPIIDDELREKVTELAVRVAKTIKYINAGTIEFLFVPSEEAFYFLEVNSRIQVEHPVTEMITGVDIVEMQIRIAAGEDLPLDQEDVAMRGHAIECRIYAEDPERNFEPSPGRIMGYDPPGGPGVRVDDGVYAGCEVPPYYDPLISKVIVWAPNREKAIIRMRRALEEYVIEGIKTNIGFHLAILRNPAFIKGDIYTRFLDEVKIEAEKIPLSRRPHVRETKGESEVTVEEKAVDAWKLSGRVMLG
ncbi:MAG: acetyl-CoA carboxylase biotin carboxylase subunit [Thermoprotei archaeon]|nr:MAG: acetyl-CoA carboxylase biotin carboxylase subunit [Thermoprotei archaeon]